MKQVFRAVCVIGLMIVAGCSQPSAPVAPGSGTEVTLPQQLSKVTAAALVPNSYIVVISSKLPEPGNPRTRTQLAETISQLQREYAFDVNALYDACLTGFAATMDAAVAERLARDPRIEMVDPDRIAVMDAQSLPTGINRVDGDVSSTISGNGSGTVTGVDVYIIDTGIQSNHPDLNVKGGVNYTGGSLNNWPDQNGHGTHVAGTAAAIDNGSYVVGVAPGADLYAVRVLNAQGSGQFSWILSGVNWVTARKNNNPGRPMVANMSLGGYVGTTGYNSLDAGIKNSITAGVLYAIAAGNSSADAKYYSPAHVTEAVTVGSYAPATNAWASYSNFGTIVDILAPGSNILSTYKGSTMATLSGTSMATPHVTGTAALYLSKPGNGSSTPAQTLTAMLYASAAPAPVHPGSGSPNANALVTGVPTGTTKKSVYAGNF